MFKIMDFEIFKFQAEIDFSIILNPSSFMTFIIVAHNRVFVSHLIMNNIYQIFNNFFLF